MMAKSDTSNEDDLVVRGSEKGYVHSMDYVGPYSPLLKSMSKHLSDVRIVGKKYSFQTRSKGHGNLLG